MTDDNLDDVAQPKTYRIVGIEKALASSVYEREIWNSAIEHVAIDLKNSYPDHAAINAYCAAIRSNKK